VTPPIGPDSIRPPGPNNWRNINITGVYNDIRIFPGQQVVFRWEGTHSVVAYQNQELFDECDTTLSTTLADLTTGGSFTFTAPSTPQTFWISCGVLAHCKLGQKVRVFVSLEEIGVDGSLPADTNNWTPRTYTPLVVQRSQDILFSWTGLNSLVQFQTAEDFELCALQNAISVVAPQSNGNYIFRASHIGSFWFGSGEGSDCSVNGQKVLITVNPNVIGVDGLVPSSNNWKEQAYADLNVPEGTVVEFNWLGTHSIEQFPDEADFDTCNFTNANELVEPESPGSFNLTTDLAAGETFLIGCGVAKHCLTFNMKVRVNVDPVVIGVDAIFPVQPNNWRPNVVFPDLRVTIGTNVVFLWDGTHSLVQFPTQEDFDVCNFANAVTLVDPVAGGNFTLAVNTSGETIFLGCRVGDHCLTLGQKVRVLVDALVEVGSTPPPTGTATNAGAIVGGMTGFVLAAAAVVMVRRKRSRSSSGSSNQTNVKRELPPAVMASAGAATHPEDGGDIEAGLNEDEAGDMVNDLYAGFETPPNAGRNALRILSRNTNHSSIASTTSMASAPKEESRSSAFSGGDMENSIPPRVSMVPTKIGSHHSKIPRAFDNVDDRASQSMPRSFDEFKIQAKASASTLKKTFQEKRDIAFRSFRPLMPLDVPIPPPPPSESQPPSKVPVDSQTSSASSFEAPRKVQQYVPPTTFSVEPKYVKPKSFIPNASDLSSPDNFKEVAARIKGSVKTRAGEMKEKVRSIRAPKPYERENMSIIPQSSPSSISSSSGLNKSASNPQFDTASGEEMHRDTFDKVPTAKTNNPLFAKEIDV